jgi:hypothetical protein
METTRPSLDPVAKAPSPLSRFLEPNKPPLNPGHRELYSIFRNQIMHEAGLINQRLSWNLSIQGFLFTAYTFTLQKIAELKVQLVTHLSSPVDIGTFSSFSGIHDLRLSLVVIAAVGALVSISVYVSVVAARRAQIEVNSKWTDDHKEYRPGPDKKHSHGHHLPGLVGGGHWRTFPLGLWASLGLPLVFIIAWPILFVLTF